VRLLLLQRALNRIMLAFCDISNACGAVKDGMLLYKRVTNIVTLMLLMLQGKINSSINESINVCTVLRATGFNRQHRGRKQEAAAGS